RHAGLEALLAAIAMLAAMLAELQVTGVIDDLANEGRDLAPVRLAIDRGGNGGHAPRVVRLSAELARGAVERALLRRELRVKEVLGTHDAPTSANGDESDRRRNRELASHGVPLAERRDKTSRMRSRRDDDVIAKESARQWLPTRQAQGRSSLGLLATQINPLTLLTTSSLRRIPAPVCRIRSRSRGPGPPAAAT